VFFYKTIFCIFVISEKFPNEKNGTILFFVLRAKTKIYKNFVLNFDVRRE